MPTDPDRTDEPADEERDELPSDPEAPGTYVHDETAPEVAEPNEPG